MEKFLLIKYFYTSKLKDFLLPKFQVEIEDTLEELFENVNVYFHFIDASSSAYYHDFIEVEHNFTLYESKKSKIFSIVKEKVRFTSNVNEAPEDLELYYDIHPTKHFLKFAIFRKVSENDFYVNDFDE